MGDQIDSQTIIDAAGNPKSATTGDVSESARDLREMVEADQYLSAKQVATSNRFPLRMGKIVPGGPAQ